MWLVINNQSALFQYSLVKVQWNSTSPQASTCSNLGSWANLIWLVIVSRIDRKKKTKNSKRLAIDSKADALNILLSQNRATLGHKLQHWGQSCCSSRSLYFRTPKVCRLCPRKRQSWRCHRSRSSWGTPIWRNGGGLCKNRPRAKYPNVGRKILPFLTLTLPPSLPPLVTRALNSKSRDEQISPTPIFPPHMTPKGVGGIVSTERHDKTQEHRETSFSNFASPTQPSPRCIQLKLPNLQPPPAPPPPFPE